MCSALYSCFRVQPLPVDLTRHFALTLTCGARVAGRSRLRQRTSVTDTCALLTLCLFVSTQPSSQAEHDLLLPWPTPHTRFCLAVIALTLLHGRHRTRTFSLAMFALPSVTHKCTHLCVHVCAFVMITTYLSLGTSACRAGPRRTHTNARSTMTARAAGRAVVCRG